MQQHDRSVASIPYAVTDTSFEFVDGQAAPPVLRVHVPPDVAIAGSAQTPEHSCVRGAVSEWAAEPWPRIHSGELPDHRFRAVDVVAEPVVGQERHPRVIEAVAADEVATRDDSACQLGLRLDPAALQEERRAHARCFHYLQQRPGPVMVRPVGVLRVERQGRANRQREGPRSGSEASKELGDGSA
jgi:hypothetical protein